MFDGYTELLPIQGAVVALALLVIAIVKVIRGVHGKEALTWNTIGIVSFLYLFGSAAWIVSGGAPPG